MLVNLTEELEKNVIKSAIISLLFYLALKIFFPKPISVTYVKGVKAKLYTIPLKDDNAKGVFLTNKKINESFVAASFLSAAAILLGRIKKLHFYRQ